ncbi:DICT sensory domain-containing protein [Halobellus rubicundus]|uniref:DICT sensory domain-containing protein n=1 Tax=Halobellus rubicundus TaxID=2996466 RepID=A0ABD5MEW8_9EURY
MTLREFLDAAEDPDRSLVVLNRTAPNPVQNMLEGLFGGQSIDVDEIELPDAEADQVLVVEDDQVLASSPLSDLQDAILFINSDLFITGTRDLEEIELPEALEQLDEIPFYLRGYPESHSEKLLLILISRYIERRAWEEGEGTLRTSFQNLSRIEDEVGTHQVYGRLDESPVDVHVYGMPGWRPDPDSSITIHAGYSRDFRESWFVVYTPPEDRDADSHVALLALEEAPNEWVGFWTFRQSVVEDLNRYIEKHL